LGAGLGQAQQQESNGEHCRHDSFLASRTTAQDDYFAQVQVGTAASICWITEVIAEIETRG
jgi:hypothetical protein